MIKDLRGETARLRNIKTYNATVVPTLGTVKKSDRSGLSGILRRQKHEHLTLSKKRCFKERNREPHNNCPGSGVTYQQLV